MTTQELHAAAKRWRGMYGGIGAQIRQADDATLLADWAAANLPPEDDEEPVSGEWLLSLGWEEHVWGTAKGYTKRLDDKPCLWLHWSGGNLSLDGDFSECDGHEITQNATRSHVRRLLKCLELGGEA